MNGWNKETTGSEFVTKVSSVPDVAEAVSAFSSYCDEIQSILSHIIEIGKCNINDQLLAGILNGKVSSELQRLLPNNVRKKAGLFFTSSLLAQKVATQLSPLLQNGCKVMDPACGAGNLLLACASYLPRGNSLEATLRIWSQHIFGFDLHEVFIRAARLRLTLLALCMHPGEHAVLRTIQADNVFDGLKVGDALSEFIIESDTCIALNPPFGHIQTPSNCNWANGKLQIAAWFHEQLLLKTAAGVHTVAILPDVLRSGTRYHNWRKLTASLCSAMDIESVGPFDESTDVDVFILHAVRGTHHEGLSGWPSHNFRLPQFQHIVSDFFDVHVGPVVPHRDKLEGPNYPYIHARTAPAWQTIDLIQEERRYLGRAFQAPFIVIHRTSSPNDKHRCVATIINETRSVAVENHLLVLLPHDKSIESCRKLVESLQLTETNDWINSRIRCRHLTVSAIKELPCKNIRDKNKLNK